MVPDRWDKTTLGKATHIIMGASPPGTSYNENQQGLPLLNGPAEFGLTHPTPIQWTSEPTQICQPGDVLLCVRGSTTGRQNIADRIYCIGRGLAAIRANEKSHGTFIKFCLEQIASAILHRARGAGSTFPNINSQELRNWSLLLPTLPEQKKIADILSSVDEAIASTQAVIDQTRKVKQGLLQQLLSRGEHSNNKDVFDTKNAPLRFLDEVAKRVTGHTPNRKKPEYWDGGIKWISLQDSAALDRVYIHETAAEISEEGIRNSSAVKHPKGTVVLSRDAGVGKSAITTDEMAVSQHFIGWICGSELDNYYLYYWLQHMKPVFEGIAIGNTIKTIGMPFFKSLKIPVPPIDTQREIAKTFISIDERIFLAEREIAQLNCLKKGLMQDLLTGRVRVTIEGGGVKKTLPTC